MTTPQVGDSARRSRTISQRDIELFTEISGDRNPIHYDEEVARASRFGGLVVQGGVTSGLLGVSGSLAFVGASHLADLGVVAVLASLYPAVTVLLARAVLSERLGGGQRVGLVLCSAAVGLIAAG